MSRDSSQAPSTRRPRSIRPSVHRVALVVSNGSNPFEMAVATEIFGLRRPELSAELYRFVVCSSLPEVDMRDSVFTLRCPGTMRDVARANTVIVPNRPDPWVPAEPEVLDAIRSAYRRGARIVSFCTGAFTLAESGILDGRTVACHWRWAAAFRERYPHIELDPDVLYVDDGQVCSSAGSAAALDLCLYLVRKDFGADVAHSVSKRLVFAMHRDGGQRQFVDHQTQRVAAPDHAIARASDWARGNLHEQITISSWAAVANMSVSTFHRLFLAELDTTPLRWLQRERTNAALRLLETTDLGLTAIAHGCGFATSATLRTYVQRQTRLSPFAYRSTFRASTSYGASRSVIQVPLTWR